MQNEKKRSCFSIVKEYNVSCEKKECPNWIEHSSKNNCSIIAANSKQYTLHEIGNIFSLSRMRICQLEKEILGKIQEKVISSQ